MRNELGRKKHLSIALPIMHQIFENKLAILHFVTNERKKDNWKVPSASNHGNPNERIYAIYIYTFTIGT